LNTTSYCGTLEVVDTALHFPGCNGETVLNNPQWVAFVAGSPTMTFEITPSNCQGQNGQFGIQGVIFEGCTEVVLASQCACTTEPFLLKSDSFQVGGVYYLVIDGCLGDVCDYTITLTEGQAFEGPPVDSVGQISGPVEVGVGTHSVYSVPMIPTADRYSWTITPPIGHILGASNSPAVAIAWTFTGEAQVCVEATNHCGAAPNRSCISVQVTNECHDVPTCEVWSEQSGRLPEQMGGSMTFPGCPANVLDNTQFFGFIAGSSHMEFLITSSNCVEGTGMQAAIFDEDCNPVVTHCPCDTGVIVLATEDLLIGRSYYLLVDGCAGDICDYTIARIEGQMLDEIPSDPMGPISGPTEVCQGLTASYSLPPVPGAGFYDWSITPPIGIMFVDSSSNPIQIKWTESGQAEVCIQAGNGCGVNPNAFCFEVNVNPPSADTAEALLCTGTCLDIQGNLICQPGTYDLVLSTSEGCDSLLNLTVTEIPSPVFEVTVANSPLHFGDTTTLIIHAQGTPPFTVEILANYAPFQTLTFDDTLLSVSVSPLDTTIYSLWMVSDSNCSLIDRDSLILPVICFPREVKTSSDTTVAPGNAVSLQVLEPQGQAFLWTPSRGLSCTDCLYPQATPPISTHYTVQVTTAEGCLYSGATTVWVRPFTVFDTIPLFGLGLQSLRFPPWEAQPMDVCPEVDDSHLAVDFTPFNSGVFYTGLAEGTDTICVPLEHPSDPLKEALFTVIVTVSKDFNHSLQNETVRTLSQLGGFDPGNALTLFPNPTSGRLQVVSLRGALQNLEVFSLEGRLLQHWNERSEVQTLELNLPPGTYLLRAHGDGWSEVHKVVVVR